MKFLSADETRKADSYTIKHEPIKSIDLMQRASEAFAQSFISTVDQNHNIVVFCGTGNNGGDGLAISRILAEKGYKVKAYIVNFHEKGSVDFLINYNRHYRILKPVSINSSEQIPEIDKHSVLIDGIFGSGLTREIEGLYAEVVESINNSGCRIFSIDIASGLFADAPSTSGIVVKPDVTISFQMPKMAFFIPENGQFTGDWEFVDIGLDLDFIENCASNNFWIEQSFWKSKIKYRNRFSHKGNFGRALIISGSLGKMGAAVLSAAACLKSGVGLLTMHIPECGNFIVQTSVPEAMVSNDNNSNHITDVAEISGFNTIGIGPGIGTNKQTGMMLEKLLKASINPIVLDADALNLISENKSLFSEIPENSIITPHIVEFERLTEQCDNHFVRLEKQRELSIKYQLIVVLKGAYSSISLPDGKLYFNSTGNPGMATAGSGDVLTGILTGLLAQNYTPETAALLGVYLHGLAGDMANEITGEDGLTASDILDNIPFAMKFLKNK